MTKLRLLDLFCGAGGAAMGYHRAGLEVEGVDIKPQKNYPFKFYQGDALEFLEKCGQNYDVIHASPPCQRYSYGTPNKLKHPDLLPIVREKLISNKKDWIIENVCGSPINGHIKICGCMVGLPLIKRVRLFETNINIFELMPVCKHIGPVITVTGSGTPTGTRKTWGRNIKFSEMKQAMGIDWMNRTELSQAIPPAYTEWLGKRIIEQIN